MAGIQLGSKLIQKGGDEVYSIAEIGQNHQGSLELAKLMITHAKRIGVNCVKFQKSCLPAKFTLAALGRPYAGRNSWGRTYGEHKAFLEFSVEQYEELQRFCDDIHIDFTASAMDEVSLAELDTLNVPFIKIGSGDANNIPMLEKAAKLARPLVISTGMQSMDTIEQIVGIMQQANKTDYALMHCVSAYPTEPINCNIRMIQILQEKFPHVVVGYSGHELGVHITKAAILLGARIVERHFTLDKSQKGSDHICSLDLVEMRELIEEIDGLRVEGYLRKSWRHAPEAITRLMDERKEVELALTKVDRKTILPCELSCKEKLGKSIVAARCLSRHQRLQKEDILIKVSEPNGIPAEDYSKILGAELNCDVLEDSPIMHGYLSL